MTLCEAFLRYWIKWFEQWGILYIPTVEFASETYEKKQCSMTESLYTSIKVKNTHEISLQWLDPTLYFCISFFNFKNNRFLTDLQFEWSTYIVTPIECCCNVIFSCSFLMHFELKIYDTLKKELCDLMKNWKCCGHTMSHSIPIAGNFQLPPKNKAITTAFDSILSHGTIYAYILQAES